MDGISCWVSQIKPVIGGIKKESGDNEPHFDVVEKCHISGCGRSTVEDQNVTSIGDIKKVLCVVEAYVNRCIQASGNPVDVPVGRHISRLCACAGKS